MRSTKKTQAGFNLIEAMVSLVVISVGMIGIAALYGQGLGAGRTAMDRTLAVNLAADMADRIRVNRMAGGAYEDDAENIPCGPGATAPCTPAQMAAYDLFVWQQQLAQQLPNGEGSVVFNDATTPPSFTISVTWQETGLGEAQYDSVIQVPAF
jgi:type IV pilus assembly protein PilV